MNKKMMKVMSMLLVSVMMISMSTMVFALTPDQLNGTTQNMTNAVNDITNLGNNVIGVLQTVGVVLSVVIIVILGIKYMMGSPEDKSEYKKSMMPYVVGAALIFAASIFANVIYGFFTNLG